MTFGRQTFFVFVLLLALTVLRHDGLAQQSTPTTPMVLTGATLIDGTGRPPVPEAVIVIDGDKFTAVGGKGTVLSMMGDQATTNGRDRTTGFKDCMQKSFPGIKVIQQPTYWKTEKATAVAQTVVSSTPDLGGIYM